MQKTLTVRVPISTYERIAREAESQQIAIADHLRNLITAQQNSAAEAERLAAVEARIISHIDDRLGRIKVVVDNIAKGAK